VFTPRYGLNLQAVCRRPLTAEARVPSQLSSSEISGEKTGTGTGFAPTTSVFPCQYHYTNAPHSSSSTCCSYQKGKRGKPGNLPKSDALSEIGKKWTEIYFHFFPVLKGLKTQ
jgi:hypothetical protein